MDVAIVNRWEPLSAKTPAQQRNRKGRPRHHPIRFEFSVPLRERSCGIDRPWRQRFFRAV